ncbi:MAG: hypothetical protein VB835_02975 [Pirellulales bacterium]
MKKLMIASVVVAGLALSGETSTAEAADFGIHFGHGGVHVGHGSVRVGIGSGHRGHYGGHYDWHNTSHFDYVPGRYRRHGNHYHYTPGRYYYHRSGHYDYHRH